ncbi:MAG: S-layer homology domain-containing protein [Lachnospiraceae bacterium]|nr:S-layer homology domain-containing protein [Lachnospiraceae bacterium]
MQHPFEETRTFGNSGLHADSLCDLFSAGGKSTNEKALSCGNWNLRSTDPADQPPKKVTDAGIYVTDPRDVLIWKGTVPREGIYRITVTVTAEDAIDDMVLFAGRRNKVARNIQIPAGATWEKTFYSRVAPYIPAMDSKVLSDLSVTVSVTGKNAGLSEIRVEEVTEDLPATVWIGGDSTLTDQNAGVPYYPYGSCTGWAQVLQQYLPDNPVYNLAHSGLTSTCFRDDGHYAIAMERIRPGDIFLFQFGHNDQKRRNLSAFGGYSANLRRYVREVREKGAYPVLISPISRIPIKDGERFASLLSAHALAVQEVAFELSVPFIDLHAETFRFLCGGYDHAADYFMPGDITHTNEYGAETIASMLVKDVLIHPENPLHAIADCSRLPGFMPWQDTHEIPAGKGPAPAPLPLPYVDIQGIPQVDALKKAMDYGLLDPCVLYLHPASTLPRAQLLMVYLRALRLNAIRPYEGAFSDIARYEWDAGYVETCIREKLIDPATVSGTRFRPDDPLTSAEFASFAIRGITPLPERDGLDFATCFSMATKKALLPVGAEPDALICRADVYAGLVRLMDLLQNQDKALPADAEIHPVG